MDSLNGFFATCFPRHTNAAGRLVIGTGAVGSYPHSFCSSKLPYPLVSLYGSFVLFVLVALAFVYLALAFLRLSINAGSLSPFIKKESVVFIYATSYHDPS